MRMLDGIEIGGAASSGSDLYLWVTLAGLAVMVIYTMFKPIGGQDDR